jgi:hypothetical protein
MMQKSRKSYVKFLRLNLLKLNPPKKKKRGKSKAKELTLKLKIGNLGITCCLDHFGPDGPECFTEKTVIFINSDHPLYQRESKKETGIMYISRLLSQELSLTKTPEILVKLTNLKARF